MAEQSKPKVAKRRKTKKAPMKKKAAANLPAMRPGKGKNHGGGFIYVSGVVGNRGGTGRPILHGRYSKLKHEVLAAAVKEFEQDPDPYNMLPEVAMARALFKNWIERYDDFREALLAWHATAATQAAVVAAPQSGERVPPVGTPAARPGSIPDIADGYRILAEVTKIIKRIEDVRNADAVSKINLFRIMKAMGADVKKSIEKHVKKAAVADAILAEIEAAWLAIRMD